MDSTTYNSLTSPPNPMQELDNNHLPASFYKKLDFDTTSEFSHTRHYKTEFATFTTPSPLKNDDPFQFELYSQTKPRTPRIRASSLSLLQNSISSAFGPSMFSSVWEPAEQDKVVTDSTTIPEESTEEPADIYALTRTIDYLGLDDPVSTPPSQPVYLEDARPRSISVSFPATNDLSINTTLGYKHGRSTTMGILETEFKHSFGSSSTHYGESSPEILSWDEMTERHQANSLKDCDKSSVDFPSHEFMAPSRSLWIGNIDSSLGSDELFNIFSRFGSIESIRMLPEKECAFVNFLKLEDALSAREAMQGGRIGNCIVRIGFGKTEAIHETQGMQPTKSLCIFH